jgi:hypothetical protein
MSSEFMQIIKEAGDSDFLSIKSEDDWIVIE